ncbi:MAG: hypothetical protein IPP77_02725 [Bacteroidetes bacterium]|nr:hypothetical protein [Bacteroidota bacterium]
MAGFGNKVMSSAMFLGVLIAVGISMVLSGVLYYFRVRIFTHEGIGDWSAVKSLRIT